MRAASGTAYTLPLVNTHSTPDWNPLRTALLAAAWLAGWTAAPAGAAKKPDPAVSPVRVPPVTAPLRPAAPPVAERFALGDSTVIESFMLSNGLRVITRHVPLSSAIAITLAFDAGDRDDPANRIGLARLLGKLRYFAATEAEPARTRDQMTNLRPAGWDLQVAARSTRLSEVASLGQFPGVLHQMAARLRGVQFTEPELRAAVESVRQDLMANYRDSLERVIVFRARALAEGDEESAIARRVSGEGLKTISMREVRDLLALQGTRQAVLSLAGDMTAYPMRALIENEFGGIPASESTPLSKRPPLKPIQRRVSFPGLPFPLASIGVVAPALTDTLHPEFYAASLRLGTFMLNKWGRPDPPFTSRFRYQLFDDPEMALFFVPLSVEGLLIPQMREEFTFTAADAFFVEPPAPLRTGLQRGVEWMLGGMLPPELLAQARGGGSVLLTLSSTAGARQLWGDESFWALYRQRFAQGLEGERGHWRDYFQNTSRQVELVLTPPSMR